MNTSKLKWLLAGVAMAVQGLAAQEPEIPIPADQPTTQTPAVQEPAIPMPADQPAPQTPPPPQPMVRTPEIPLADPPQSLTGDDGEAELDLVDPFQRGSARGNAGAAQEEGLDGMSPTSLGEISDEFRILAIVIPDGGSRQPMALIRLQNESSPQVVMKEDLVQIKRRPADRQLAGVRRAANAGDQGSLAESALNALDGYSFYLHIKDIQPTYIEAYQKKSPNETIILRW